jgi:hypothetical protein
MRMALLLGETDAILTFRAMQGNLRYNKKRKSSGCNFYLRDRRVTLQWIYGYTVRYGLTLPHYYPTIGRLNLTSREWRDRRPPTYSYSTFCLRLAGQLLTQFSFAGSVLISRLEKWPLYK